MEPYLLIVTLVLGSQAPHTYQVEFTSKGFTLTGFFNNERHCQNIDPFLLPLSLNLKI